MEVPEINMENIFNQSFSTFNIIFTVISIFSILIFGFVIAMFISPKLRGKFMSNQLKATKHMIDYSKDELEDIGTNLGNVSINMKKNILDENEDVLREIASREADIRKDSIKTYASAIKEGIDNQDTIYCKHCGSMIDSDSRFCKNCGKEQ